MQLMTKEIEKIARKQFTCGADLHNQNIVAKFFDPCSSWTWFVMNQDPEDPNYLWGIVKSPYAIEEGSFSLADLQKIKNKFGLGMERDKFWTPRKAIDVWNELHKSK